MKKKITVDGVLVWIVILGALMWAVTTLIAFPTVPGWCAAAWAAATALGLLLAKKQHDDKTQAVQERNDLNELFRAATEEKLLYRGEKEELEKQVLELEKDVDYWKALALMKDTPEPEQEDNPIADAKASVLKAKRRTRKKPEE